jgi:predicted membrane protein
MDREPDKRPEDLGAHLKRAIESDIKRRFEARATLFSARPLTFHGGFIWGAVICLIGVAILLDHMGFIAVEHLYRFWPLILVFAGLVNLSCREGRLWGGILLAAGVILQLDELGIAHIRIWDLWPLAIIGVGAMIIWSSFEARRRTNPSDPASPTVGDSDSTLNMVAVFGGSERRVGSQAFRGGKAMAVFGGIELDLRDALIEGDEAVLELNCIFGGVEIHVPRTWNIDGRCIPVFGGYSDETRQAVVTDPATQKQKTLVITGNVLFGGVEISN